MTSDTSNQLSAYINYSSFAPWSETYNAYRYNSGQRSGKKLETQSMEHNPRNKRPQSAKIELSGIGGNVLVSMKDR